MRAGFTILEVVFALLLFQVGVLAVAGTFLLAQASFGRAEQTLRGVIEAAWIGDSLAAAGAVGSGSHQYPWGQVVWAPGLNVPGGWDVASVAGPTGDTLVVFPAHPVLEQRPLSDTCSVAGPVRVRVP